SIVKSGRGRMITPPGPQDGLCQVLLEHLLLTAIEVLERRPDLADRIRHLVVDVADTFTRDPEHMTVGEYAQHRCVTERSIRYEIREQMVEGVHYHRDGRSGRRVIIHVAEADRRLAARTKQAPRGPEELAVDEVTRRRARVALRRRKQNT